MIQQEFVFYICEYEKQVVLAIKHEKIILFMNLDHTFCV